VELFHPARIALTGIRSGPEFDKLTPLMDDGHDTASAFPVSVTASNAVQELQPDERDLLDQRQSARAAGNRASPARG
jgi:hypothetical protein